MLEDGRSTQTGTPEEIRATPRSPYAADLVGLNLFAGHARADADAGAGRLVTGGGE